MDKNPSLISYQIFEGFDKLFAFTTLKNTLGIESIRYSNAPENKQKLAEVLELPVESLVFPKQTHTNCVFELSELPEKPIDETDALLTNQPGLCLCVQTADCVPVLLFDSEKKVVAAVHAGWRGTVGKIVEVAVQKMLRNYDSNPEHIFAAIGPSISPDIYEVGDEVVSAAQKSIPNVEKTFSKNGSGKFHFNLWEANRQLLLNNGIPDKNIQVLAECSFIEKDKYYSARREGINTGRMVSGIMIKH